MLLFVAPSLHVHTHARARLHVHTHRVNGGVRKQCESIRSIGSKERERDRLPAADKYGGIRAAFELSNWYRATVFSPALTSTTRRVRNAYTRPSSLSVISMKRHVCTTLVFSIKKKKRERTNRNQVVEIPKRISERYS